MIIKCEHGFYTFVPEDMDDQAYFEASTGYKLVRFADGLTFAPLASLSEISIKDQPYGGLTANVNYCGLPEDVMRANGFVFDLAARKLAPLDTVNKPLELYPQVNGALIAVDELPQAGAVYNRQCLLSFTGVARWQNRQFILRMYELQNKSN